MFLVVVVVVCFCFGFLKIFLKIMFESLQEFGFSWYSIGLHLAVCNLRLGFGLGFLFSFCFPKSYRLQSPVKDESSSHT